MAETKPIHVEFVDDAGGTVLGTGDIPAEQLPQLFQPGMHVKLAEQLFHVASAVPATAALAQQQGKLTLRVRLVQQEQQKRVLYTVPTIEAELPALDQAQPSKGKRVLQMHEDQWRQVELVGPGAWKGAEKALREVERIQFEERVEDGRFRTLYPRKDLVFPLAGASIALDELVKALPAATQSLAGVAFDQHPFLVQGGWALLTPATIGLYGTESAGRLVSLALVDARAQGSADDEVNALVALMQQHKLKLVDWVNAIVIGPERKRLTRWFAGERG